MYILNFCPNYCLIRDIFTNKVLLQGKTEKGLYKFSLVDSRRSENAKICCNLFETTQSRENMNKFDLWHYKLGHPSLL